MTRDVTEPEPIRRGSERSLIAKGGIADGISIGDEYVVQYDGDEFNVNVIRVSETRSVLRIDDLDVEAEDRSRGLSTQSLLRWIIRGP